MLWIMEVHSSSFKDQRHRANSESLAGFKRINAPVLAESEILQAIEEHNIERGENTDEEYELDKRANLLNELVGREGFPITQADFGSARILNFFTFEILNQQLTYSIVRDVIIKLDSINDEGPKFDKIIINKGDLARILDEKDLPGLLRALNRGKIVLVDDGRKLDQWAKDGNASKYLFVNIKGGQWYNELLKMGKVGNQDFDPQVLKECKKNLKVLKVDGISITYGQTLWDGKRRHFARINRRQYPIREFMIDSILNRIGEEIMIPNNIAHAYVYPDGWEKFVYEFKQRGGDSGNGRYYRVGRDQDGNVSLVSEDEDEYNKADIAMKMWIFLAGSTTDLRMRTTAFYNALLGEEIEQGRKRDTKNKTSQVVPPKESKKKLKPDPNSLNIDALNEARALFKILRVNISLFFWGWKRVFSREGRSRREFFKFLA
jgi:hypothetical protein